MRTKINYTREYGFWISNNDARVRYCVANGGNYRDIFFRFDSSQAHLIAPHFPIFSSVLFEPSICKPNEARCRVKSNLLLMKKIRFEFRFHPRIVVRIKLNDFPTAKIFLRRLEPRYAVYAVTFLRTFPRFSIDSRNLPANVDSSTPFFTLICLFPSFV